MLIIYLINTGPYSDWLPLWDKSWRLFIFFILYIATIYFELYLLCNHSSHLPANNNGGSVYSFGRRISFIWGVQNIKYGGHFFSLIDIPTMSHSGGSQQFFFAPSFPNNGTLTDCSQSSQRWGVLEVLILLEVDPPHQPQDPEPVVRSTNTIAII